MNYYKKCCLSLRLRCIATHWSSSTTLSILMLVHEATLWTYPVGGLRFFAAKWTVSTAYFVAAFIVEATRWASPCVFILLSFSFSTCHHLHTSHAAATWSRSFATHGARATTDVVLLVVLETTLWAFPWATASTATFSTLATATKVGKR